MDAGLDYSVHKLLDLDKLAQDQIKEVRRVVKYDKRQPPLIATASNQKDRDATDEMIETNHGVGFNWVSSQMKIGGFATISAMSPPKSHPHANRKLSAADISLGDLQDDISRQIDVVKDLIVKLGKDIGDLFKPKTNTDEVLARLKENFVDAVLDILSNAINFLLKAISLVIQEFKEVGHYKMDVPIFSAL